MRYSNKGIPKLELNMDHFKLTLGIPSGNVGEVSCTQASSEEFTLIAIKGVHREIFLLKGKRVTLTLMIIAVCWQTKQ